MDSRGHVVSFWKGWGEGLCADKVLLCLGGKLGYDGYWGGVCGSCDMRSVRVSVKLIKGRVLRRFVCGKWYRY